MTVILKAGKNGADCASYCLISLLSVDAKILTTTLAHGLQTVLLSIIHSAQSGFMKGHQVFLGNWSYLERIIGLKSLQCEPDIFIS